MQKIVLSVFVTGFVVYGCFGMNDQYKTVEELLCKGDTPDNNPFLKNINNSGCYIRVQVHRTFLMRR